MARQVRPIGALGPLHKVHHFHLGSWVRNWTGLRAQPHDEKWTATPSPSKALLRVPVTLSHVGSSRRHDGPALLARVNQVFLAAGVAFEALESADWDLDLELEKMPSGEWRCPFGEEVDHQVPCLHLGLVQQLGDLEALTFGCGRCLVIPDSSGDRAVAEALACMLGLELSTGKQSLMTPGGAGVALSPRECETLRAHAGLLLGQHSAARRMVVPIWAYQVCTPSCYATRRSAEQLQQLFDGVNEIWEQADLELQMHAWCHLQEDEVSGESWAAVLDLGVGPEGHRLQPSAAHDPHALHAFFVSAATAKFGVAADRKNNLLVMRDQVGKRSVRAFGRVLGSLLGLPVEAQAEQLMCPQGEGTLLNAHEIEVARRRALALVFGE